MPHERHRECGGRLPRAREPLYSSPRRGRARLRMRCPRRTGASAPRTPGLDCRQTAISPGRGEPGCWPWPRVDSDRADTWSLGVEDRPRPSSPRTSCMTGGSVRSATATPSRPATCTLRLRKSHALRHLQARHQISSGAQPIHPRGDGVRDRHAEDIARPHLQPVGLSRSTHARDARETASTGGREHGDPAHSHPRVDVDGDTGLRAAALDECSRATFQATVRPVLTLTAGPKIVAPASSTTRRWPFGQRPGQPRAAVLEPAVRPSTSSAAMPTMMPMAG